MALNSQNSRNFLDLGLSDGTVTKWGDITFSSQFVTFQVRCVRCVETLPGFEKVFFSTSFPGTWYKCDDFVTSSLYFSGFSLERNEFQNLARSGVLGSMFSNSGLERPSERPFQKETKERNSTGMLLIIISPVIRLGLRNPRKKERKRSGPPVRDRFLGPACLIASD